MLTGTRTCSVPGRGRRQATALYIAYVLLHSDCCSYEYVLPALTERPLLSSLDQASSKARRVDGVALPCTGGIRVALCVLMGWG